MTKGHTLKNLFLAILGFVAVILFEILFFKPLPASAVSTINNNLRRRYGYNNIIFYFPKEGAGSSNPTPLDGDGCYVEFGNTPADNAKTALIYLMSVGYTPASAAVITGVMRMESGCGLGGINPNVMEGHCRDLITDESFKATSAKGGFGLMQWTDRDEKENLQKVADSLGLPAISLKVQLTFLVRDLACSKEGDCDRTDPKAMHKKNDAYAYFDTGSLNTYSARSLEEAGFWIARRYTIPSTICSARNGVCCVNSDGTCRAVNVPRSYPAGAAAIKKNGGGQYINSGSKYIDQANELYKSLSTYCQASSPTDPDNPDNPTDPDNPSDPGDASGPEGIDASTKVFKPCPTNLVKQSTHTGKTYDYTYDGKTYKVANTKLDLDSYISYLKTRRIAQDGQICDPLTNKCVKNGTTYNGKEYTDKSHCLHYATVFAGNLARGECTSTDYGAANYAGAISQANPDTSNDKADGRLPMLQKIYDYILDGKVIVVKVAATSGRHFVTAVGVRANANRDNLVDSDILYLDTNGKLTTSRKLLFQDGKGGWWIKAA